MPILIPYSVELAVNCHATLSGNDAAYGQYSQFARVDVAGLTVGVSVNSPTTTLIEGNTSEDVPLNITPPDELWGWDAATGAATMDVTLAAVLALDIYDEPSSGSRLGNDEFGNSTGTGIDTFKTWPNNLRQVHGRYGLRFHANMSWTAMGTVHHGIRDQNGVITWPAADSLSNSGTITTDKTTLFYDPADLRTNGAAPHLSGGMGVSGVSGMDDGSLGQFSVSDVSVSGTTPTPLHALHWQDFNETYTGHYTIVEASGGSVSVYFKNDSSSDPYVTFEDGDSYGSWGDWRAGLTADAADWVGTALTVRGLVTCLPGDGQTVPVTAQVTPYSLATQIHKNESGPYCYYARAYYYPEAFPGRPTAASDPILSNLVKFRLDPESKRAQETFWGDDESCWIVPPTAESPTWNPFSVSYATANITVDAMDTDRSAWAGVNIGAAGDYEWKNAGLGTGGSVITSGGKRVVVTGSDAASARIYRTLLSDWDDCAAGPNAWATAAGCTYGNASGRLEWYLMMRKFRTNSDVFNWGNRRWLKIVGVMASGTGTFTLRINADSCDISDDWAYSQASRIISVARAGTYTDISLTFGATETTLYVDLAAVEAACGHPMNHVTGFEFRDLQASKEYRFDSVSLVMGGAGATGVVTEGTGGFKFWTGGGYSDDTAIVPVVDGMAGARQKVNGTDEYALRQIERWTSSTPSTLSPRNNDCTRAFAELYADVNVQEGLSATGLATPSVLTGSDWALFLDAGWHTAPGVVSATVKMADVLVPVCLFQTWAAKGVFSGVGLGIAIDTPNMWGAASEGILMDAGQDGSTWLTEAGETTDSNGAWVSAPIAQGALRAPTDSATYALPLDSYGHRWTAPGVLDGGLPATEILSIYNLGVARPVLHGTPTGVSAERPSLAIDTTGIALAARVIGLNVIVARRTVDSAMWVAFAYRAGKHPAVYWWHGDEHVIYVNGTNSIRDWDVRVQTEVTLVTGTHPCVAINQGASIKALAYLVGTAYKCTIYSGEGNVIGAENTILASGAPNAPGSLAWRLNGDLEFQYTDGTALHTLVSADLGVTWA